MSMFCFKPFDIGKWFVAGFAAFLMQLQIDQDLIQQLANLSPGFQQWTINEPLAAAITFGLLALIINSGLAFLNARGLMILYDNIVKNKAQISRPWKEYAEQANSLFIASLIINVPLTMVAVVMGIAGVSLFIAPTSTSQGPALAFAVAALVLLFIGLAIVNALLYVIVAPVMYARRLTVLEAWAYAKENVLPGNVGNFVLLLLAFIPLGIAALLAGIVLMLCTCCIAIIPYIGAVILLPITVFFTSISLFFVEGCFPAMAIFDPDRVEAICPECAYDLRGSLHSDYCPECGTPVSRITSRLRGEGIVIEDDEPQLPPNF